MRVPLEWLADYVDLDSPVDTLAQQLTMTGLKVEGIERIGENWQGIVVGHVIEIEPHPRSRNPLQVARVDLGDQVITLVTGAPNVRLGDKVPVVLVGSQVPFGPDGGPMLIEERPMAGITSQGMMASARELGISDEHTGIFVLPESAPIGAALRSVLGDDVLDIETNPNRADTLSVIGIAREVAAVTGQRLTLPYLDVDRPEIRHVAAPSIAVQVDEPDLCPRYSALRISGVSAGQSPAWMQERLRHAGQRSINVLVDITNYVLLEYGQPMHAFDARQLAGNRIIVRRAREGETITTLDGTNRTLDASNLVIADADRAVAVAGVMGGENSEVSDDTTEIVLESATFDPVSVRRTAQSLGLRTEASARFEKALPPETTVLGLRRAVQLLADILQTPIEVWDITDVWTRPERAPDVAMPMRDLRRLIGMDIDQEQAAESLSLLGFDVDIRANEVVARVPYWRRADVTRSADLVEEVARLVGFDAVPVTLPSASMPPAPLPVGLGWEYRVRERLLALGLSEALTHSLTSPESMARLAPPGRWSGDWATVIANPPGVYAREALTDPVRLANPATRDRSVLRLTLLPSLLDVVARNLKHTDEHVAFFEIARTFFWRGENELPYERRTLTLALAGARTGRSWADPDPGPFTFFDVKGKVQCVLEECGISEYVVNAAEHPTLHPGRSATLTVGGDQAGWFGELHQEVASAFDLAERRVQVAELDFDTLIAHASAAHTFRPLPRFPAVYRDLAVVVGAEVPAEHLLEVIRRSGSELLEEARIFDVYQGPPLDERHKSVAISMEFRAPGSTLTQSEVADIVDHIVNTLRTDLGASIRE